MTPGSAGRGGWVLAGVAAAGLAGLLLSGGCGPQTQEGAVQRIVPILLKESGPVVVNGVETPFLEVGETLKTMGVKVYNKIEITVTPEVPESRKQALVAQIRKAGFERAAYVMSPDAYKPKPRRTE